MHFILDIYIYIYTLLESVMPGMPIWANMSQYVQPCENA